MRHMASEVAYLNGDKFRPAVARLLWNCDDLRCYLANNTGSLIDYNLGSSNQRRSTSAKINGLKGLLLRQGGIALLGQFKAGAEGAGPGRVTTQGVLGRPTCVSGAV
jgi:hypothetical protein